MAEKNTILMHEDPSKETWAKPKSDTRSRFSTDKNFTVKFRTDSFGTISLGKLKSKAGTKGFGISIKKEF